MYSQHHRFRIWNQLQHPFSHSLEEFGYINPALPETEVTNLKQTIDWLVSVLYPQVQDAVDTPGDLPAVGNTIGDYRVVTDDGDGRAAAYRWQQLEGDVTPQWYKIYDMDWGEQTVLSNFLLKTQDVYVYRYGIDDLDETGSAYTGDLAGQRIYGGASAGTHLTLYANSGDGTGPGTGFVQFGDDVRPLVDSAYSLGTDTYRFLNFYTDEANVGTMQIQGGSITDSSGNIDLGATTSLTVGTTTYSSGAVDDTNDAIDYYGGQIRLLSINSGTFGRVTTGQLYAGDWALGGFGNTLSPNTITFTNATATNIGGITAAGPGMSLQFRNWDRLSPDFNTRGAIDLGATNLEWKDLYLNNTADGTSRIGTSNNNTNDATNSVGLLLETGEKTVGTGNSGDITIRTGDTSLNASGDITLQTGNIAGTRGSIFLSAQTRSNTELIVTGAASQFHSNVGFYNGGLERSRIRYSGGNTYFEAISGTSLRVDGGNFLYLDANTAIQTNARLQPTSDNFRDIGLNLADDGLNLRYRRLSLSEGISDGTNKNLMSVLLSLRDIQVGVADKYGIWWDAATSKFIASAADDEIVHGNIDGLSADDHAQYLYTVDIGGGVYGGRSGGQYLTGGIGAGDNLYLDSTSNATKGIIEVRSPLVPDTNGGVDLGAGGNRFNDFYMVGQAFGLRIENLTSGTLGSFGNTGRLAWTTDTEALYVDTGTAWKKLVSDKYTVSEAWNGTETTKPAYDVSAQFDDAREAVWQFLDNTNGFREVQGAVITKTATTVTVNFTIAPAAGSYTLVGVG